LPRAPREKLEDGQLYTLLLYDDSRRDRQGEITELLSAGL